MEARLTLLRIRTQSLTSARHRTLRYRQNRNNCAI